MTREPAELPNLKHILPTCGARQPTSPEPRPPAHRRGLARILRTPLLAIVLLFAAAAPAGAGTYTAGYDFVYNPGSFSGWYVQSNVGGKSHMCGLNQNDCSARTVLGQSTAGVGAWAKGEALGAGNLGRVAFVPPADTVLTAMSVDMQRVVENNGFMRVQIGGRPTAAQDWGYNPIQSIADSSMARLTYTHSGSMATGYYVQLVNTSTATQTPSVRNGFSIKGATATLSDGSAPVVEAAADFSEGWYTGGIACATVRTTDAGGGVNAVSLLVDGVPRGTVPKASGSPYVPGIIAADTTQLCVDTTTLSDGEHTAQVVGQDVGSNKTVLDMSNIKVARAAPTITTLTAPAASSVETTPSFRFHMDAGASGLATGSLTIDDKPVGSGFDPAPDGTETVTVDTPLAVGDHTWRARIVDNAGRAAEVQGTFKVVKPSTAMTIAKVLVPPDVSTNRAPSFRFRIDVGDDTLEGAELFIDGASQGTLSGDSIGYVVEPDTPLSFGQHTWEVVAISTSGAIVRLDGTFVINPATPMTIVKVLLPDDVSTNRAPSFRFRIAAGEDALESAELFIDGASLGEFSGDSIGYVVDPETPLSIGKHTWEVVATSRTGAIARLEGTFVVTAASGLTRLDVRKSVTPRGGRVRIVVRVLEDGKGVKGRLVTCVRGKTRRRARTNSQGKATCVMRFRNGPRKITVSAAGIPGKRTVTIKPAGGRSRNR